MGGSLVVKIVIIISLFVYSEHITGLTHRIPLQTCKFRPSNWCLFVYGIPLNFITWNYWPETFQRIISTQIYNVNYLTLPRARANSSVSLSRKMVITIQLLLE